MPITATPVSAFASLLAPAFAELSIVLDVHAVPSLPRDWQMDSDDFGDGLVRIIVGRPGRDTLFSTVVRHDIDHVDLADRIRGFTMEALEREGWRDYRVPFERAPICKKCLYLTFTVAYIASGDRCAPSSESATGCAEPKHTGWCGLERLLRTCVECGFARYERPADA